MNRFCVAAITCTLICFVCSSDSEVPDAAVNDVEQNPPLWPEQERFIWYRLPFHGSGQGFLRHGEHLEVLQFPNLKTGVPTTFYCTPRVCMRADEWPNM